MRLGRWCGWLTGATLLTVGSAVWAQTPAFTGEIAPGFEQCLTERGETTMGEVDCYSQAYDYWDAELNRQYKAAQNYCDSLNVTGSDVDKSVAQECRASLKEMQLRWIRYRDAMQTSNFFLVPDRDNQRGNIEHLRTMVYVVMTQAQLLTPPPQKQQQQ